MSRCLYCSHDINKPLYKQIQSLQQHMEDLEKINEIQSMQKAVISALKERITELEEVLEFYADTSNYVYADDYPNDYDGPIIEQDFGKRAREVLK